MIFIAERIPEAPSPEIGDPGAEFVYSDFHEVRDWMQFSMPDNSNFSLNIRVLRADPQIVNGKPQERFIIEYLPLGRMDYNITHHDIQEACDHAQKVAKRNLPIWFNCEGPEVKFMVPHERVIQEYSDKIKAVILQN